METAANQIADLTRKSFPPPIEFTESDFQVESLTVFVTHSLGFWEIMGLIREKRGERHSFRKRALNAFFSQGDR